MSALRPQTYLLTATLVASAGVGFSGYLSAVRLFTRHCAFNEPCPLFLGQPACYTGFALFLLLLAVSSVALVNRSEAKWPAIFNVALSGAGLLFAGYLTARELPSLANLSYGMGLPTCAYGFVFFAALFVLSAVALGPKRANDLRPPLGGFAPPHPQH